MYRDIAVGVYKRAVDAHVGGYQIPAWGWAVLVLDVLVFLPAWLMVSYTFSNIYPVLAMVEDPSPPAYEPVSLNEDTESLAEENTPALADEAARAGAAPTRAITSSFRAINRTIYGINGWRSNFRGLGAWLAMIVATMAIYGIISAIPFVPGVVAGAISAVTLVQLYTAWCHIVISAPSAKPFWRRLPTFRKAFHATALPTVAYFIALEANSALPRLVGNVLGLSRWDPQRPGAMPEVDAHDSWKAIIVVLMTLALTVLLVIPAHVVLSRVQASLLPEEDETIVPFDRSFQGKVEPAIVGGKGFVSMRDAWMTFERAAWVRLVKLYLKIFAISFLLALLWIAVVVPEVLIMIRNGKKIE